MRNCKALLEQLTELIPPGAGQRHNITLNNKGDVEICLMLGERYRPVFLEDSDFDKPVTELVAEIYKLIETDDHADK